MTPAPAGDQDALALKPAHPTLRLRTESRILPALAFRPAGNCVSMTRGPEAPAFHRPRRVFPAGKEPHHGLDLKDPTRLVDGPRDAALPGPAPEAPPPLPAAPGPLSRRRA